MKAIAIDVDNTIGDFQECAAQFLNQPNRTQLYFNKIMDDHPQYLRPDILYIFFYIKMYRTTYPCKVFLFTNNLGGARWINYIKNYIHKKTQSSVIDDIILAKRFEPKRMYESKTVSDFQLCSSLPADTPIFFVDDQYHPGMQHDLVYYIQVKPYRKEIGDVATQYILQHLKDFLKK
jgi:hypothetical protein